jgi:hypothetical protein
MVRAGSWCDRCLDATLCFVTYCKCVTETLIRYVGPLFVVIAFTLIYGGIYIFFAAVFPFQVPEPFSLYGALHLAWCAFLFQGLMFNYLFTIITPPGAPPPPVRPPTPISRPFILSSRRLARHLRFFDPRCISLASLSRFAPLVSLLIDTTRADKRERGEAGPAGERESAPSRRGLQPVVQEVYGDPSGAGERGGCARDRGVCVRQWSMRVTVRLTPWLRYDKKQAKRPSRSERTTAMCADGTPTVLLLLRSLRTIA